MLPAAGWALLIMLYCALIFFEKVAGVSKSHSKREMVLEHLP